MKLVNVILYACAYYSEAEYEDNIWIKDETYQIIKEDIPDEIFCGELDGKHSQVDGDVEFKYFDEAALLEYCDGYELETSGCRLEEEIIDVYEKYHLNFEKEQEEIKAYIESLDNKVDVTIRVKKSKKEELIKFAETLK